MAGRGSPVQVDAVSTLRQDPTTKEWVIVAPDRTSFKNHGARAGTSLVHPPSQLVATPVAPIRVRRKYEVAIAHYDDTGRCLYCDLVDAELRAGVRVVLDTDRFVVFQPFASSVPFETWIAPKRHQPSFAQATSEEIVLLARVLKRTLLALETVLGPHDFNYIVHSAPIGDEHRDYYLWHIQILPRVSIPAGFERGSGIFINSTRPEQTAATLRRVVATPGTHATASS